MSLARAFTTRRSKKTHEVSAPLPQRSLTTKYASGSIRNKISAPVELLSTTNMLSYNAPDLCQPPPSSPPSLTHSSSSSARSVSSDEVMTPLSDASTDISTSTTSLSSVDSRSPSPNHLSCYFEKRPSTPEQDPAAPVIPQRSPSHTKRNHEIVHRKRSVSRLSSRSHSVKTSVSSFARESLQLFGSTPELVEDDEEESASHTSSPRPASEQTFETKSSRHAHPFGAELAQVTELTEEFSHNVKIVDADDAALSSRGLYKFAAIDYMAEIETDFIKAFGHANYNRSAEMWI